MKKLIIAPDSYKGSLTAKEICDIIGDVARVYFPGLEIIKLPIADGGEGLVDALLYAEIGDKVMVNVKDPLWRDIEASYGILGNGIAVIEMAAASGLPLLKRNERNVLDATTFGTGQLIKDALERGCREFILGLGGSATNDGGAGAAGALGIHYIGTDQKQIFSGKGLRSLERIDDSGIFEALKQAQFTIACDVTNPLHGSNGAAFIFGPQKGASVQDVSLLDEGLENLANVVMRQTGVDLQAIPGTGAAGGMVVPFLIFTNAQVKRGLDVVLDTIHFDHHLEGCDLVITGEGRTDYQSSMGKALSGIGLRAMTKSIPVIAISGALQSGYESLYENGISAFFSTCREVVSLDTAIANAAENLRNTSRDVFRLIKLGLC
jgi:glycerate 2-kinase